MSNGIADSAVGAILEIPPQALADIDKAEKAIKRLALTSAEAAGKVNGHWGVVATHGLDVFINKLADAKKAMDGLGTINVTLNTQAAVQSSEQLSTATQKTSQDVSKAVQDMAASWNDLAKVSIKSFDLSAYGNNLTEALSRLSELKGQFKNEAFGGAYNQAMADEIRQLEEAIRLYKQASDEKNKALSNIQQKQQAQTDKEYLTEQKRLLDRILQLRKDIANISISVQRGTITGKEDISKDLAQLEQLRKELRETGVAYKDLRLLASLRLSDEGKVQSEIISQNAKNAGLRQEIDERNKLNQAITRANELTAQGQQGKTRLGSGEEAAIQRQLNSDYKAMLGIIREQGELKAKVASEGRQMTQQEIDLVASLAQRYKIYYDDIQRVSGAYSKMSEAAAKNFQADKSEQMARNAILLADAQNKAAEAAQKVADAQAKAAQQQADKDRSQAESDLNRLYTERIRLLKEKEQLENKALVNTAKGLPDLTAKENQLLTELTAKLQSVDSQIQTIGNSYAGLAAKAKHAYELPELRQSVQLQNQFNDALNAVDTSKTKQLVAEYKRLYAESEKIQKSIDAANNFGPNALSPQAYQSYLELLSKQGEIYARMTEIERKNIQEIADFRMQKDMEANQRSISEFIQAEAQKTAKSKEEAEKRLAKYRESLQSYQGAMRQADAILAGDNSRHLATNLENIKRAINDLKTASGNLNLFDPSDVVKAEQIKKKIAELTQVLNRYKDATNVPKEIISPQQALSMAKNATTLRELESAYKALKEAMANTKTSDPQWSQMNAQLQQTKAHIDEIKKKMGEFQSQASKTSNVMGQLQGRIAAAFSVGAITGFIKKMVEVRAQFELQRVALGAIIQDRDEASKIFTQVQNMALESPFNIMQLEKATKQIAAFGFETQKLVPTMKMFADISAGLGVEIDRLVLVMGHLRARNFLEGTMVRQFTNMGFNVLGELSKYYSELEDRMVSVGEVQDRVKKKMVSFEDVEEVLKRVTSAGGMFYDMQKKQSDSLWGQMQRIQDAYDLMLNEIGQSNEGILKSALATIRNLINHWRDLKPVIVATVSAMGAFGASMLILRGIPMVVANITRGFNMMGAALSFATKQQLAMNAAQKANAWGALLSVVVAIGVAIYEVATAQSKLNEELERIENEGLGNMYNLIFQYRQLADTIKDTNKTYEERKEAMDEMKRVYGEILPDQMLEIDNIKQMKDGYNEATEAIKAHYEEKIKKQKEETIKGNYEKDIKKQVADAAERFKLLTYDAITKGMGLENIPEETYKRNIENILTAITKEVEDGIIPAEEASNRFKEVLMKNLAMTEADYKKISLSVNLDEAFKDAFSHQDYYGNKFGGAWVENSILSTLQEMNDKIKRESESILGNLNAFMAPEAEPYIKQYELLTEAVGKYKLAIENLFNLQSEGNLYDKDGKLTKEAESVYNELYGWIDKINEAGAIFGLRFQPTSKDVNDAIQSNIDKMEYFEKVNILTFGRVTDSFDTWGAKLKNNTFLSGLVENWKRSWQSLNLSDEQREIRNLIKTVGELNNVDLSKYKWALINSKDNVASVAKEVKAEVESLKTSIQKYQTAVAAGLPAIIAQAFFLGGKTLEEVQQTMKAVDELSHKLGNTDKKSKGGKSDKELKRWQDLKKAIEDVRTAYEKARKSFTVEESNKQIEELFGATFKELGADIKQFYKDGKYDAEALIDALEVLLGMTKATTVERKKLRSEIQRKIADTNVEINVKLREDAEKQLKKDIDEMFANYELTEELKKLNLNVDLVFMLGGEPMDLNDLKAKLKKDFEDAGGESAPKNIVKEYKDSIAKIADLELKQRKERIKEYNKYFVKTVGERAQIELEYLKKMDDVRKMYEFTDAQRQDALRQLTEEKNKKLADQVWKDFKDGEVYQMIFKDLDNISESALVTMRTELERIRDSFKGLSPKDLKEINKAITNINEQIVNRNPFKALGKSFKDLSKYAKERKKNEEDFQKAVKRSGELTDMIAEKEAQLSKLRDKSSLYKVDQINEQIVNLNKQIAELEKDGVTSEEEAKIDALKEQIRLLEEKKKKLEEIAALNQDEEDSMHNQIKGLESDVSGLNEELKKSNAKADGAGKKLSEGSIKAKAIQTAFQQIKQYAQETVSHIDGIIKGLDRMGVLSDAAKDNWESFMDGFEAMNDIAEGGINTWTGFMTGNYAQAVNGILQGIKGTINFIASIFEVGDKKKERQIKSLTEKVEALDKAYQKLEKSIEDAYNFAQNDSAFNSAKKNLGEQKKSYEEILALEKAKKKTDKDKVKEYEDKLEEIAEKEKELRKQMLEDMGSTTDYRNAAEGFVSAWLDAFKETGDGLDALNDKWDEFIESMFIKQAAMAKAGDIYKNAIDIFNKAFDKGKRGDALQSAIDEAEQAAMNGNKVLNDYLKGLAEIFHIKPDGNGELILSDLQKGIQNITEPQAAAIESYLNSMRFAVFRHTEQLDTLIATIQMQYGSGTENPVVTELKGIRSVLDSINTKFDSVIGRNGSQKGIRIAN